MAQTIIPAIAAFIGTNIDDLFINMLFFSETDSKRDEHKILLGKYMGIGALIAAALIGAYGMQIITGRYIYFLGIIPVLLGIKEIIGSDKEQDVLPQGNSKTYALTFQVMTVTIANGADNIGIYTPLFAGFDLSQIIITCAVFRIMTALWCFISKKIIRMEFIRHIIENYRKIIVPAVYIILGIYIITKGL